MKSEIFTAGVPDQILIVGKKTLVVRSGNRVWYGSLEGEQRGEQLITKEGIITIAGNRVYATSGPLLNNVKAITDSGITLISVDAVPSIPISDAPRLVSELLFNDRDLWRIVYERLSGTVVGGYAWFKSTRTYWQAGIVSATLWILTLLSAVFFWVFAPHKLASWAMPVVGRPTLPSWKWLAGLISFYSFLGQSNRAITSWLIRNDKQLFERNFGDREAVCERANFCDLDGSVLIERFIDEVTNSRSSLRWIVGPGGSGKSALAFEMVRRARIDNRPHLLPILVDEDWPGSLADYLASLLRVGDRIPTAKMVEAMGASGRILVIVDSLSERGKETAQQDVGQLILDGLLRRVIITSRNSKPSGASWEGVSELESFHLTEEHLPEYIQTYAPNVDNQTAIKRLAPLTQGGKLISPLYARFAIVHGLNANAPLESRLDLVLRYVEGLRRGRLDLGGEDMLRAAGLAAYDSVIQKFSPREIEREGLRGIFAQEAKDAPFLNEKGNQEVKPARLVSMLEECGLITRNQINHRVQFAYDPVAELLAAHQMLRDRSKPGVKALIKRVRKEKGTGLNEALQVAMAA